MARAVCGGGESDRGVRHVPAPPYESGADGAALEARVVALREQYGWWRRKLQVLLAREGVALCVSTIHRIVRRHGLLDPQACHRPTPRRFERATPNALWQVDFKGQYPLRVAGDCYPLSLVDDHSRYVVGLYALSGTRLEPTWQCFVRTFRAVLCERRAGAPRCGRTRV